MFDVQPAEIERLRSPGGDRSAGFVNDVIYAHALVLGIPASAVHLTEAWSYMLEPVMDFQSNQKSDRACRKASMAKAT